jgi:hypothetical protein
LFKRVLATGAGPDKDPLDESGVDVPLVLALNEPEESANDVVEALISLFGIGIGSEANVTRGMGSEDVLLREGTGV